MNDKAIEDLLEKVLDEFDLELGCIDVEHGTEDRAIAMEILTRRLLPLLEAGQAMADHVDTLSYEDVSEPHNCSGCGDAVKKWEARKRAALQAAKGS